MLENKEVTLKEAAKTIGRSYATLWNHRYEISSARQVGHTWVVNLRDAEHEAYTFRRRSCQSKAKAFQAKQERLKT